VVSLVAAGVALVLYGLWLLGSTPLLIFSGVLFAIVPGRHTSCASACRA
jgi:hypothetical protein